MACTQAAGSESEFGQLDEPVPCHIVEGRNIKKGKRIGIYYPQLRAVPPMKRKRERRRSQPHGKYKSELRVRRKKIWLGNFSTIEKAMIAYDIALHYIGRPPIHNRYHPLYFRAFRHDHKTYTDPKEIEEFLKDASKDSFEWECFRTYVRDEQARILGLQSIKRFLNRRMNFANEDIASEGEVQPQLDTSCTCFTGFHSEFALPPMSPTETPLDCSSASSPSSSLHIENGTATMISELHVYSPVYSKASNAAAEFATGTRHFISGSEQSFGEMESMSITRMETEIVSACPSSVFDVNNIDLLSREAGMRHFIPGCELSFGEMESMPTAPVATGIISTYPSSVLEINSMDLLSRETTDILSNAMMELYSLGWMPSS